MTPRQVGIYRLDSLLGSGGTGDVYRSYDTHRDRYVALKLLPEAFSADEEYLKRFRRESHIAARLTDPHVIPIHDFGAIGPQLFIDMRLVDGADLGTLLNANGPMAPQPAVDLIGQVAQALDAAHADQLVHRDIKPSNLLVTANGFVYVVDFGTAPTAGGQDADGRADVYSLACVLHECLTGDPPSSGRDLNASSVVEGVPPALDAVIARGMASNPKDRYATAGLLAAAAREALLPPDEAAGEPARGPGRRRLGVLLLILAAALAIPVTLVATASGRPDTAGASAAPSAATGTRAAAAAGSGPRLAVPTVAGKIKTGQTPSYVQVAPDGKYAYVANPGADAITVLDTADDRVSGTIKIPQGPPQFVSFSPNGRTAYVSVYKGSNSAAFIAFVDTATRKVTATVAVNNHTPGATTVKPGGQYLYVPNHNMAMGGAGDNVIDVIDVATKKVTADIPVAANPHWIVFDKQNGRFYATNHMSAVVTVLDSRTNSVIKQIVVGETPHSEALAPDGRRLAVTSFSGNEVFMIDTATDQEVGVIPVGRTPLDIAYSPDGRYLFTVDNAGDTVTVIDTADNRVIAELPTGKAPTSISVLPDGRQAYVTDENSGTVEVLNIPH